jgi:hypothetical protein
MSDDLNDFLRQAALRREARKRQTGSQPAPSNPPPGAPPAAAPVRRATSSTDESEGLERVPIEQRHLTPQIPAVDRVSPNVAKVDQQREAHLREVFGNRPEPLSQSQSKKSKKKSSPQPTDQPAPATPSDFAAALDSLSLSQEGRTSMSSSELIAFLRNPDSLKMAFIASEIFGRKFQ